MTCLLPPMCIFCRHFHHDNAADSGLSCDAYEDIPDEIFSGEVLHHSHYKGDGGIVFILHDELREEFYEVNELREKMNMTTFIKQPL